MFKNIKKIAVLIRFFITQVCKFYLSVIKKEFGLLLICWGRNPNLQESTRVKFRDRITPPYPQPWRRIVAVIYPGKDHQQYNFPLKKRNCPAIIRCNTDITTLQVYCCFTLQSYLSFITLMLQYRYGTAKIQNKFKIQTLR